MAQGRKVGKRTKGQDGYHLTVHRHSVMNRPIMKAKGYLFGGFVGNSWWWWQHDERESVRTQP